MSEASGNAAQTRIIADQVAEATITQFFRQHPELSPNKPVEVPPPLKWAAAIIAALLVAGIGGSFTWLVTTVNEMQVTLARMDERMAGQTTSSDNRLGEVERRVARLERFQESGE